MLGYHSARCAALPRGLAASMHILCNLNFCTIKPLYFHSKFIYHHNNTLIKHLKLIFHHFFLSHQVHFFTKVKPKLRTQHSNFSHQPWIHSNPNKFKPLTILHLWLININTALRIVNHCIQMVLTQSKLNLEPKAQNPNLNKLSTT